MSKIEKDSHYVNASAHRKREAGRSCLLDELCLQNYKMSKPFVSRFRTFLFSFILFYCVVAFAGVSEQDARDFALRCVRMSRTDEGDNTLRAFMSDEGKDVSGAVGMWFDIWHSEHASGKNFDLKGLNIDHVFVREPDLDNPMQMKLTDYETATCLVAPEKIAVVYLSNANKDMRAVLIMPLVSRAGKIRLCPMLTKNWLASPNSDEERAEVVPIKENLSTMLGVEIIKIADDADSYGIVPPSADEKSRRTFKTNPQGCTLQNIVLYAAGQGTWVTGLDRLPPGRFSVQCELLDGESGTVEEKVLNAVANAFRLSIKKDDGYLWNGYRVTIPNPLPDCFKKTKEPEGQSASHGRGDYEGYSLQKILSEAVYGKPVQLLSRNKAIRYDVHLQLWPEAYGEMVSLQQLGFGIVPAKIPERTIVIGAREH